jgi:hypothetical protein
MLKPDKNASYFIRFVPLLRAMGRGKRSRRRSHWLCDYDESATSKKRKQDYDESATSKKRKQAEVAPEAALEPEAEPGPVVREPVSTIKKPALRAKRSTASKLTAAQCKSHVPDPT